LHRCSHWRSSSVFTSLRLQQNKQYLHEATSAEASCTVELLLAVC